MGLSKILVAEDDKEISYLIQRTLKNEGYDTQLVDNGKDALECINSFDYDLIILDIMMPKMDGLEVLQHIRQHKNTPVMIISAKGGEQDKVLGLGIGADDYISKPFFIGEFLARVKAQLRRYLYLNEINNEEPKKILKSNDLELNRDTYEVKIKNRKIMLTAKEFAILELLLSQPAKVFSKTQIFSQIWKEDFLTDDNTVMVHINRLRNKIEADPSAPKYIQTVWGIGYRFAGDKK
ncbi:DNA-binding response OmpR family regulator [Bacillus thermophilus]|uniref:DNA-binding response OmpR family regulator n=1 Tax=Siminovitchia thermophila TaxID=1245522 RepID=A0ABS2R4E8_9BACI|nr:response regulator transcription factor [Siminovitchia thermophila]MBM7714532.1 DNA-binding response OmpR family regulator [Siminovitchia thermophila]ONK22597.1 DNA-binding response regulator [Bacillus sp. VT-16-64]